MEQTINVIFGGSIVGLLVAIGLLVFFYKWTGSKWVVAVVAVFLLITRFTFVSVEPKKADTSGGIEVIGETKTE